jgi:sulfatase maturation enzyme AslB (radical SAM superfamily)
VGKCGHMVNAKDFDDHQHLEHSSWLADIKKKMEEKRWPKECRRCEQSERVKGESIRTKSIERHKILHPIRDDYLVVGGVLDNICNSACQSCYSGLSTKIGSLQSKNYPRVNNLKVFKGLPQDRIIELDVSGGEPTASKNYKSILKSLPVNVKIVRMNTNGSRIIPELEDVLKKQIMVIITMSLDGIGNIHDYTRWPIRWADYVETLDRYQELQKKYKLLQLDAWTTVSCLNVNTLPDIVSFAKDRGIPHDWAFLDQPSVLNVRYTNHFTLRAKQMAPNEIAMDNDNTPQLNEFIARQDSLRGIDIKDYLNF